MAGMHFIILKVNGVDVSQMPHEEAVQMFLKASEPILVEVRRRSYNTTTDAENSNNHKYLEKSNELSQQLQHQQNDPRKHSSPTKISIKTSAELQQTDWPISKTTENSDDVVDSLKFQSLVISSSKSSTDIDNCANLKLKQSGEAIVAGVDNVGCLPNAAANSRTFSSALGSDNQTQNRGSMHENSAVKSRHASISSITSSPVRSAPSSPLKESLTKPTAMLPLSEDDKNSKVLISIGIQTDNFTSDFIFNGSAILNSEQIIENDHNLFSECLAPEIDIEEITLRKSEGNERLGLTVCYSSGGGNGSGSDDTDTCTEVYISDIVADSIAGRDGRLRQGDQILQVNGKDVSNKEETETLIAENNNAVTLLVSRYLYGDDDEYHEQGDYYEEDEPNMDYAKCFLENYIVSEDSLKSPTKNNQDSPDKKQQQEQFQLPEQQPPIRCMTDVVAPSSSDNIPATTTLGSSISRDPLNHQNIRARLEQVNQEIAILDSRVENMMMSQKKNIDPSAGVVAQKPLQHSQSQSQIQQEPQLKETIGMPIMDYDTEHIYETIPEDSESEPFYCSPYESSEHQNRIEQWLDMQDGSDLNETRMRSLQNHKHQFNQQQQQHHENLSIWTKVKNGTLRSTNSSAGDDHENSSSAYNTGGSCNSNTMTPLTLELNTSNYRDREFNPHSQSTLILCSTKHNVSPINETTSTQIQHLLPLMHNSSQELQSSSIVNQQRNLKDKLPSPSHSSLKPAQPILPNKKIFPTSQKNAAVDIAKSTQNNLNTPIPAASNTMYTNVANLHQTMLLQQQLFRQALIHQQVPSNSVPCPQFTAPNLSQYHFVSSQEVSTVKLNTHPNEEQMVWKVKRRQDGSRYIVRRPARNRFLRNRALRISAERNDQTTEDDTISEIKTGRYWTKEERKKHIERARERRQRQQIIITNKNNEISMLPPLCSAVSSLNSEAAQKNVTICGGDSVVIQQNSQQQQKLIPSVQSPAATTGTKIYRQSTPSSTTKKLVKKNTTNSPVDVNNSNTPLVTSNTSVTGTLTTSTTTPSGTRMVGLLSVTIV